MNRSRHYKNNLTQDGVGDARRKEVMTLARDLGYSAKAIEKLKKAKTEQEIAGILADARKGVL